MSGAISRLSSGPKGKSEYIDYPGDAGRKRPGIPIPSVRPTPLRSNTLTGKDFAAFEKAYDDFLGNPIERMGRGEYGFVFKVRLEFGAFAARKLLRALPGEGGADRQARAYREYNLLKRAPE